MNIGFFFGFDCNCNASNTNIYKFNTDWEKNIILEKAKFVDYHRLKPMLETFSCQ